MLEQLSPFVEIYHLASLSLEIPGNPWCYLLKHAAGCQRHLQEIMSDSRKFDLTQEENSLTIYIKVSESGLIFSLETNNKRPLRPWQYKWWNKHLKFPLLPMSILKSFMQKGSFVAIQRFIYLVFNTEYCFKLVVSWCERELMQECCFEPILFSSLHWALLWNTDFYITIHSAPSVSYQTLLP